MHLDRAGAAMTRDMAIGLADIDRLTNGHLGKVDIACPFCGPLRRSSVNRRRKVLRIWRLDEGFATYHCARCGESGHTRDTAAAPPDPVRLAAARRAAEVRERKLAGQRLATARWLWNAGRPASGTPAEAYLRSRCIAVPIPPTIKYLHPRKPEHHPTMLTAFGMPAEPAPGMMSVDIASVRGVHLTLLKPDGSGKADTVPNKLIIGRCLGYPLVLAPMNDLLGVALTEGIEDALTVHQATGVGAWAAGAAGRMPALADVVPTYVECVTIFAHPDDKAGRDGARKLASALRAARTQIDVAVEGLP